VSKAELAVLGFLVVAWIAFTFLWAGLTAWAPPGAIEFTCGAFTGVFFFGGLVVIGVYLASLFADRE
jgi:hypothetical protein